VTDAGLLRGLTARFGTPLYVYDLDEVDARHDELRAALPERSRLLYSLKANPLPALGECLSARGCDAEVSSEGELSAALASGFCAARMLYTGPGKSEREIGAALAAGVRRFSCESWTDAERLARVAEGGDERPVALLRVSPALSARAGLSMSSAVAQFGLHEEALFQGAERMAALRDRLDFAGFHVYLGTQLRDAAALEEAFRAAAEAAFRVSERLGVEPRVVDLGGGFPWPFATEGEGASLVGLHASLTVLLESDARLANAEIAFESGRRLCASSGTLVSRVIDVKRGAFGKRYAVLDAGIQTLGGLSGLGRVMRPSVSAIVLDAASEGSASEPTEIVGPLCTPADVLAQGLAVAGLTPGALVAVPNVGAYGLTASLTGFLSRPPPIEVVHRGGEVLAVYRLRAGHARLA
jgi:diaminopimelate decarboxylase